MASILPVLIGLQLVVLRVWINARHRLSRVQMLANDHQAKLEGQITKLEFQLARLPRVWADTFGVTNGRKTYSPRDVASAFANLVSTVQVFVPPKDQLKSFPEESVERIKALFFADLCPDDPYTTPIFPNEHQYTPEEIVSLLGQSSTWSWIIYHIIHSILLNAVSVVTNKNAILLPLESGPVRGLTRLFKSIRAEKRLFFYISS